MLSQLPAAASGLIPFLDPAAILEAAGPWALVVVCLIVFAETALLVGFILPGDTLLIITGVFVNLGTMLADPIGIQIPIWWVCLAIAASAFIGGEVGYLIGHKAGPAIFERRESGLFSKENVIRTNKFFDRFGPFAVIAARFVPVVRTFTPIAAGVGHMNYRKYSLFNAIGAVIWGAGLTFAGFLVAFIEPLKNFIVDYIDVILIIAVLCAVLPTGYHYIRQVLKARKLRKLGLDAPLDDSEAMADIFEEGQTGKPKAP